MATILLQAAGGFVGGILGGPFGAVLGRAVGGLAGAAVDSTLFGGTTRRQGARLSNTRIMQADEGAGIARVYGTARVAGQVIWTTRFEEETQTERQGGKGGGQKVETTTYSYFGNVAVGLCEGPIAAIRRIWADGEELDLETVSLRVYLGDETQAPDPLIEAQQGPGRAPAYRGLAYLVFERMPLGRWGNRIPQISCEVLRPVGALEGQLKAVTIIPGASEHGLDPAVVRERIGEGEDRLVNRNMLYAPSDWAASLDELQALCPALQRAALVVSWFGDDLRAGHCRLTPRVEISARDETEAWRVGPITRGEAERVSWVDGGPAYGGTPSDAGVLRAIADLRARGLSVTYYPFMLMDVPPGNGLPDPYGGAEQAAFPWRGRISLDIAPERGGTADRTATARSDIAAFLGTAEPSDFSFEDGVLTYSGPDEWSYRRMIFHQAHLAAAAGVDAFVIGSELRGLTRLRDDAGHFPFVEGLIDIAGEVKAMLPGAVVTYAADWSEYFGYHPEDGSGDVFFNLDPLWASDAIDVIGIDDYLPLADWRDEVAESADAASVYDRDGLSAGIAGGEYFDWYYLNEADRAAKARTAITDGAAGKPWVFRAKDLLGWWSNLHFDRRGGVELGSPSPYVPKAKPIWLTELGCPAIDKGPNQPNVFVDPKSSESHVPHFSAGGRDDLVQRRFLETQLGYWDETAGGFSEANNPVSPIYGGRMVDASAVHVWTWDARPYPAFPGRSDLWRDGENWRRGHWLSGRLGNAPADALIAAILKDHAIADFDVSGVEASLTGYVDDGPSSARDLLEGLLRLTGTAANAADGRIVFRALGRLRPVAEIDGFAELGGPYVEMRRAEAGDGADMISLSFLDPWRDYQPGTAEAARAGIEQPRQEVVSVSAALEESEAKTFAALMLQEAGAVGEAASFGIAPAMLAVEAGDVLTLAGRRGEWLVSRIETGTARRISARRMPQRRRALPDAGTLPPRTAPPAYPTASRPKVAFLDLPLPDGGDGLDGARFAVSAAPWTGYGITRVEGGEALAARATAIRPAKTGRIAAALGPGPEALIDRGNRLQVSLGRGALYGISRERLYGGENLCAVECRNGSFEVLQFERAEEIAPGTFLLSGLLRAKGGTEDAMAAGAAEGALFVLLDAACGALGLTAGEVGRSLDWRIAPLSRPADDPAAVTVTATLGPRSVRPLSPVHLRARFAGDGALTLSWIRRTRTGGDSWETLDVPLGEERELYRIDMRDGGGTVLTREAQTATVTITADEQIAAFGALPASVTVDLAQMSPVWGAGTARRAQFSRPA
ncbi:glycoside hydrolase/phage tail family protein [Aurantimonas sp. VKM B-3413]|uniref:baseplate multidomain protein megatron n=1 Tax=Aurantimonas sp. VKM B-3413 TaxID=2779401 RepID=UPI001E61E14C|nr:glycoside hydrolase/phage tail family protein [Aurantimonas sp. VKM B-3413]MCB8836090.1 glycoside hydrolase/phage tail family protein [Aurantimonas sp. VKM B-3413]